MRLKELRKQRHISQVKIAMDLNVSQNTISRYETGEREAGYDMLIRIADYFDISVDYLLERTDDPVWHRRALFLQKMGVLCFISVARAKKRILKIRKAPHNKDVREKLRNQLREERK